MHNAVHIYAAHILYEIIFGLFTLCTRTFCQHGKKFFYCTGTVLHYRHVKEPGILRIFFSFLFPHGHISGKEYEKGLSYAEINLHVLPTYYLG